MNFIIVAAMLFWPTVLGGGFYFIRRYIRAVERRSGSEAELAELRERMVQLEEALEGTRTDVARLETSQEFTQRLLSARRPGE